MNYKVVATDRDGGTIIADAADAAEAIEVGSRIASEGGRATKVLTPDLDMFSLEHFESIAGKPETAVH